MRGAMWACATWGLALTLLGCGGGGKVGAEPGGEGEGEGEGEPVGGAIGDPCLAAVDCAAGLQCDPVASTCTDEQRSCTSDDDCGTGSACAPDGACVRIDSGAPCTVDDECPGGTCLAGACGCGGEMYAASGVPANVLIAIDRSGSMDSPPSGGDGGGGGGGGGASKWEIAKAAVASLLAAYGDQVRFGLMLWPGTDESCDQGVECGGGAVFVDVGPGTAQAINDVLSRAGTCNLHTPIGANVQQVAGYAGLHDPAAANYLLLVTDGQENCDGDGVAAVTALRGLVPEVKTFVVGFGGEVDPAQLAAMAQAGGTAQAADPVYFQADDAAGLEGAFLTIGESVLSCAYVLAEAPPDPDGLAVYIDRAVAPRDAAHADGWDYDAASNQMTFFGPTCDHLQSGTVGELLIVYGCPPGFVDGGGGEPGVGCPNGVVPCTVEEDCAAGFGCSAGCCVLDSPF